MKLGSSTKSDLSCKLWRWILKEHSIITFLLHSQAVTKQLLQENGTHSCATGAHIMCFARRVLFMHHELRSNLAAAIAPCFSDVCGYSCKDVQTSRLTVRSCSPLYCHCLRDTHTGTKRKSLLFFLAFGPKVWRSMYKLYKRCWMKLNLQDTGVFLVFNVAAQRVFALPSFRDFQARR